MIWLIVVAYVLIGIGVSRAVSGWAAREWRYADSNDPEIVLPSVFGGAAWPVTLVWFLLIRPIFKVIGPGIVTWYSKPYRQARGRS